MNDEYKEEEEERGEKKELTKLGLMDERAQVD